jgi:hypothetical protein
MIIGRSPHGAPNSERSPGRLTAGARPEFHYVTPSVQTVFPHTLHANLAARTCGILIETPPDGPVTCRVRGVGNRHHTALIAGSIIALPGDRPNFCLTKRHEPGSQSRREGTDLSPVVGRPLVHGANHRSKHGQGVVEVGQGVGQFSQAEG